jgi:hypothetical protein
LEFQQKKLPVQTETQDKANARSGFVSSTQKVGMIKE